jgi:hypothetical protein
VTARLRFTCRHRRLSRRLFELSGKTPRCGRTPPRLRPFARLVDAKEDGANSERILHAGS